MSFRPSLHGWPFANDFRPSGFALGLGAPAYPELGLGGGMCWTALDRYLAGIRVPRDVERPSEGEPLHAELVARQVASVGGVWERVRTGQSLPSGSWRDRLHLVGSLLPGTNDLGSVSRSGWRSIRKRIDASEPVLLVLLAETDGYARSTAAWQVLAYGYTKDGGRVTLSIYDPSRPEDDDHRLAFSLRGDLDARLTGGRRIRGFVAVPYDRRAPESLRGETFADRSVIGMNRKVRGRLSCAPSRGGLDLVARDPDGALLHFRRAKSHWEGVNVTERENLGSHELYSDPVAVKAAGALHVFAKSYVGDLLHFTRRRTWDVDNRTDTKRAGARFRLEGEPVPVALNGGAVSVVGRGKDGVLVHYTGVPFRGWTAEEVSAAGHLPLQGDPLAIRIGRTLHVVGRSREGHVLHFERLRGGWSAADATQEAFPERTVRLVGRPALLELEGTLHVFGRDDEDRLVELVRDEAGRWTGSAVCDGVHSDPTATRGPAGVHVFAVNGAGDLIHAWRGERWHAENLGETRPCLPTLAVSAPLASWGEAEELRVFGRAAGELWLWVWRPDSDWTTARAHARAGMHQGHRTTEPPALVLDSAGRPHAFTTDGRGTVVHLEPGAWLEPDPVRQPIVPSSGRPGSAPPEPGDEDGAQPWPQDGAPADAGPFADEDVGSEVQPLQMHGQEGSEDEGEHQPIAADTGSDGEWEPIDGSGAVDLDPATEPPADAPASDPLDPSQPLDLTLSLSGGSASADGTGPGAADEGDREPALHLHVSPGGDEGADDQDEDVEETAAAFDPGELEEDDADDIDEEPATEKLIHRAPRSRGRGKKPPRERIPRKVVRLPLPLLGEDDEDEEWREQDPLPLLEEESPEPAASDAEATDDEDEGEWDIAAALDLEPTGPKKKKKKNGTGSNGGKNGTGSNGSKATSKPFRWEPDRPEPGEEADDDELDPLDVNLMDAWPESSPRSKRKKKR